MITNQPSTILSFRLRAAVAGLFNVSTLLLLIAISTNHWINANGRTNIEFVGIWNICNRFVCEPHSDIIHAKVFLVCAFILGFFGCAAVSLGLWANVTDMKKTVGKIIIFVAILDFAGMISATVYLTIIPIFKNVSYGLILGWIATVLCFVASCLSFYHASIEPDIDSSAPQTTPDNIQPPPGYTVDPAADFKSDPPPSYASQLPPSSIIVS